MHAAELIKREPLSAFAYPLLAVDDWSGSFDEYRDRRDNHDRNRDDDEKYTDSEDVDQPLREEVKTRISLVL
jgi:hypothetical protein